jgi:hypothetical protein
MTRRLHAEVVLDLDFVTAAQVHAAVALLRVAELDVQPEVAERPVGHEVRAGFRAA